MIEQRSVSLAISILLLASCPVRAQQKGDTLAVRQYHFPGVTRASDASLLVVVEDPHLLTGHRYSVIVTRVAGDTAHWELTDMSSGMKRGSSYCTAKDTVPRWMIADGLRMHFRVPPMGMKIHDMVDAPDSPSEWGWRLASGTRRWTWVGANQAGYPLEGFNGGGATSGCMGSATLFWGGNLRSDQCRDVLLRLCQTDSNGVLVNPQDTSASYAYRFLGGSQNPPARPEFSPFIMNSGSSYSFQEYVKGVPLAAYDMETYPPTRLVVAFLENNVPNGTVDGRYWPPLLGTDNSTPSSAREWLFILREPYTYSVPDSTLIRSATNLYTGRDSLALMWVIIADRRNAGAWSALDQFDILAYHQANTGIKYVFTTEFATTVNEADRSLPLHFGMQQNYPNPFNPSTTIRYTVPERCQVNLAVYNTLGQLVVQLVKGEIGPGHHDVTFDATTLSSGVYLCRLFAGEYATTRKLILAR